MKRVLFVCTGNVCRSPMAAALFGRLVRDRGDAVEIESAGTWALDGQPASGLAQQVMAERGLALASHRAHTITSLETEKASVILVMTENQRQALAAEFPLARAKLHLLSELESQRHDIADPYGGPRDEYDACAKELDRLVTRGYDLILRWAGQPDPEASTKPVDR